jgi:hypothetical protein
MLKVPNWEFIGRLCRIHTNLYRNGIQIKSRRARLPPPPSHGHDTLTSVMTHDTILSKLQGLAYSNQECSSFSRRGDAHMMRATLAVVAFQPYDRSSAKKVLRKPRMGNDTDCFISCRNHSISHASRIWACGCCGMIQPGSLGTFSAFRQQESSTTCIGDWRDRYESNWHIPIQFGANVMWSLPSEPWYIGSHSRNQECHDR